MFLLSFLAADYVPDWQPRSMYITVGMVEARSVHVKNTTTSRHNNAKFVLMIRRDFNLALMLFVCQDDENRCIPDVRCALRA